MRRLDTPSNTLHITGHDAVNLLLFAELQDDSIILENLETLQGIYQPAGIVGLNVITSTRDDKELDPFITILIIMHANLNHC